MSKDKPKPLIEAIFQIRWKPTHGNIDKDYKLAVGKFHSKINKEFPILESTNAAMLPDDVSYSLIQYKFKTENDWPLIQLGPGILTVNHTEDYSWEEFKPLCINMVENIKACYNELSPINIVSSSLKYINAFPFNFSQNNMLAFVKDKMKIKIELPENLFDKDIKKSPHGIQNIFVFKSDNPSGDIILTIATAKLKNEAETIVMQTEFKTENKTIDQFDPWLEGTHTILKKWFRILSGE